ncbi:MAG: UDP-N-acetylmuramate--L-alanine ligase [bacterium]|nr:UDP-N-acetylmuramate--L-alanine ligase [bacterium]
MEFTMPQRAHFIGIGGINMSGLAKLLNRSGVRVTGSDVAASELTEELHTYGIDVKIGHAAENVPVDADIVIYSSAVPESNPERAVARSKGITQQTNFEFLGAWSASRHTVLICGTHGKSTTTAIAGLLLVEGGFDPTVFVGSRVTAFKDGNVYLGKSDLVVIEGDEYAKHFLAFEPSVVVLNNIELDHTDVYPTIDDLIAVFRELLRKIRPNGFLIANADDARVQTLIGEERGRLEAHGVQIKTFGFGSHADRQIADYVPKAGAQVFAVRDEQGVMSRFSLRVPGRMNVMNAVGAMTLAANVGVQMATIRHVLETFPGIWRRFETVLDRDGITIISDYGHHPTAVAATLEAAKGFFPGRHVVLCFQPHHRNRTKHLFQDFIPCFDKADALILTEIYDVAGREATEDENVSSRDLQDAVLAHDEERGAKRVVEYVPDPKEALAILKRWKKPGDVIIVMGAGDIYKIANRVLEK